MIPYWILKKRVNKETQEKKGNEENKENYARGSGHGSISGWNFDFAPSITRANSFLKTSLHPCTDGRILLKIASLCIAQMLAQHIAPLISP